ncbi:MAG: NAD(P)-dependent oxidoreductase [Bacteroidetes bacterium]|nr:NAD(P)-dependent oxidoreductase [Bacteroidota bacterium]
MNILVTGASGYIGSHLVNQLLKEKHKVFCTLLENEKNPFGEKVVKSFIIYNNKIDNCVDIFKKNKIDGIIHLASFVQSGHHKPSDVEALLDTNIKLSVLLLEAATHARIQWFINTGTYWQNFNNKDYSPVNLYAATKEAFMDIARLYSETNKIQFKTIKLFDTYGPNDKRNKMFNIWGEIALTGEVLDMSPGEQIIDITYIDDIIQAFLLLACQLHSNKLQLNAESVYYVMSNERYSLKELAAIYEKVHEVKLQINWGGRPYNEREIMEPLSRGSIVPGWKPKYDIIKGLRLIKKTL